MKYLLYGPLFLFAGTFVIVSFLIGAICYLWEFNTRHFKLGFKFLNSKTQFAKFMDNHF